MPKATTFTDFGIISSGTLNSEHLISPYFRTLRKLNPKHELLREVFKFDRDDLDLDEVDQYLTDVSDAINELLPQYVYFGHSEYDPTDVGIFVDPDAWFKAMDNGEILSVDYLSEVPINYTGEVFCHGHYFTVVDSQFTEIWHYPYGD